jgi:hypothetical protein
MPYSVDNEALRKTIGQCLEHGWAVHIVCEHKHSVRWNVAELAERFAPGVRLEDIAERLVCKAAPFGGEPCNSTNGSLTIRQDVAFTQARDIVAFEGKKDWRP